MHERRSEDAVRTALTRYGRAALVMIDLQEDILQDRFAPATGDEIARTAGALVERVRAADGVIVHVHHDGNPIRERPLLTDISYAQGTGEVQDVVFADAIDVLPHDVVVGKRQWGAFYGTDLDQQLRARDVGTIILAGVTTNFGVESTAREAFQRGYQLVFAVDAMGSIDDEHHDFSIRHVLPRIGCVTSSSLIATALERGRR